MDDIDAEVTLFNAVKSFDLKTINMILDEFPKTINARNSQGRTPLLTAAASLGDHADIVEILLAHGADIQAKDKDGWTAFDWADFSLNRDIIALLETNTT